MIHKIISGGQTGADRGGLDAAIMIGLQHGGFCPKGRLAEDGMIPAKYLLQETHSGDYIIRTAMNVMKSDATLIITGDKLNGGSKQTYQLAEKYGKPKLHIPIQLYTVEGAADAVFTWSTFHGVQILNVAGNRESKCPGIYEYTKAVILKAFQNRINRTE